MIFNNKENRCYKSFLLKKINFYKEEDTRNHSFLFYTKHQIMDESDIFPDNDESGNFDSQETICRVSYSYLMFISNYNIYLFSFHIF